MLSIFSKEMSSRTWLTLSYFILPMLAGCDPGHQPGRQLGPKTQSSTFGGVTPERLPGPLPQPTPEQKSTFQGILEIKGIHIGMADDDALRLVPGLEQTTLDRPQSRTYQKLSCKKHWGDDEKSCQLTLANRRIESADLYFLDSQLGEAVLRFDDKDFNAVDQGLREKFGLPYSKTETGLKNRLTGVESIYIEKLWTNGKGQNLVLVSHRKDGDSYSPEGQIHLLDMEFNKKRDADSAALGYRPGSKDM